jgi:predicted ArsR family transcriptional regulator
VAEPPIDPRTHRVLAGTSRVRILELLRARGAALTAPEVAAQVGLHPNTVRMHLDQLAEAGLVTCARERRTGPGRPRLLFTAAAAAAPGPDRAEEDGYRMLAGLLAGHLERAGERSAADVADAGREWARAFPVPAGPAPTAAEATERVVQVLDELGFAPRVPVPGGPVELHRCPFQQVAERHSRIVCGVHLGLMQGLLDDLAAPVHAARLEPFVAPGLCLAHLTPATSGPGLPTDPAPSRGVPSTPPIEGHPS